MDLKLLDRYKYYNLNEVEKIIREMGLQNQKKEILNYININDLKKSKQLIDELGSHFQSYIKIDKNFISDVKNAIESNDFSNVKDFVSKFNNENLTKIRVKKIFNQFNIKNQETVKIINEGIESFNNKFSNFIYISIENNMPSAVLNLQNLKKLPEVEKLKLSNIGKIPVSSIMQVLEKNNLYRIKVNEQIITDFKSKSIITKSNAFNNAFGRNIIDPVRDMNDTANLVISSLCKQRSKDASFEEESSGKSLVTFNKGPTASSGNIEAYNFNINFNYIPLENAGVNFGISGSAVRINVPSQINIQKNLVLNTNFSFGAAVVKGNASLVIGDYTEKLYSIDKVLPIGSAEIGFMYSPSKDVLFRSGLFFVPGVETTSKNGKFQFSPTIQNSIFTSLSVKI